MADPTARKDPDGELYTAVGQRRTANDGMVWQAPIVSLTAQAFLLTIALAPDSASAARYISAGLAFVAAVASFHLMAKHRTFERLDSEWLKRYEKVHYKTVGSGKEKIYAVVHHRTDQAMLKDLLDHENFSPMRLRWLRSPVWWATTKFSAYHMWQFVLFVFGLGAAVVLLVTPFRPGWLTKQTSCTDCLL
jgi:hypothetical protein